ncbi:MAG: phosphatidate cytidylyltransferase [Flavobacteriales bacterium]
MKEVIVRTISGALYITVILFALLNSRIGFVSLFSILAIICLIEYCQLTKNNRFFSLISFLILYAIFSVFTTKPILLNALLVISLGLNFFLLSFLFSKNKQTKPKRFIFFYIIFGFIFLTLIPYEQTVFSPKILIAIFIIIWSNDTFAYLIGKNFGHKKLMPSISPKKTIEGFFGGLFAGCIASLCIYFYFDIFNLWIWLLIAIIISVFGTLGDLFQSKIKRLAGVKDSGKLMPGHGGIYDRLDSIIFASPFIYALIQITRLI